jgi:hypothetical protein
VDEFTLLSIFAPGAWRLFLPGRPAGEAALIRKNFPPPQAVRLRFFCRDTP